MTLISPSLASAPHLHLASIVTELEAGGADMLHFDIEDGVFVPMMTLGTRIVCDLRPLTRLPFDLHLMMVNPEWILPQLIASGANRISVHYEACPYPRRTMRLIAEQGVQAGLAFNAATPLPDLTYLRPYLSFIVILTTEPEIPDGPFLPQVLNKIRAGKQQEGLQGIEWVVDGGIHPENAGQAAACGADVLVAGRAVFQGGEILSNLRRLRQALA